MLFDLLYHYLINYIIANIITYVQSKPKLILIQFVFPPLAFFIISSSGHTHQTASKLSNQNIVTFDLTDNKWLNQSVNMTERQ